MASIGSKVVVAAAQAARNFGYVSHVDFMFNNFSIGLSLFSEAKKKL